MSYRRSVVRYNCFCMKKGNPPPNPDIVSRIEEQFTDERWGDFSVGWDVMVAGDKLTIVSNIKDVNKVMEVCAYAHIAAKSGLTVSPDNEEDAAIIHMIESQFLDGRMDWLNYRTAWGIRWDTERSRVETYLLRTPRTQTPVTQEMIDMVLQRGIASANEMYDSVSAAVTSSKEDQ